VAIADKGKGGAFTELLLPASHVDRREQFHDSAWRAWIRGDYLTPG
jgi:hypothetical protein